MRDIYVSETNIYGSYIYRVMIDGKAYDSFITGTPLTWAQTRDVESYYAEALDNYDPPVLE